MKRIKKSASVVILLLGFIGLYGQKSVNSGGGDAKGSGGTAAYSIGQVVYTSETGSGGSLAQGVQQAYEIFTVSVHETQGKISMTAFPNPTVEKLNLEISDYNNERWSYQLTDVRGKQLSQGEIIERQTQIEMNKYPCSSYFINILNQENQKIQSFKIIKH